MRFLLGCLGVGFVVFGGCVFVAGVLALPSGSDAGFLTFVLIIGAAILIFGVWALYRALTMHRPRSGADPPQT
jgi:uncharacterized membrane protein HdeD (DUF308 family)